MAYPKKTRHLRSLVIHPHTYRWRLRVGTPHSSVRVYGPIPSQQCLTILLHEWADPWVAFPHAPAAVPRWIGPRWVRQAIDVARRHGWMVDVARNRLHLVYQNGQFRPS